MLRKAFVVTNVSVDLAALGQQIRTHRKALRINSIALAEAAGMSRVTLHRIEKGEPSVAMGAYLSAAAALGLRLVLDSSAVDREGWIPARVRLAGYPQLARLAWQVQGTEDLTPREAWNIYERNWRHVDTGGLTAHERHLIDALRLAFGNGTDHV